MRSHQANQVTLGVRVRTASNHHRLGCLIVVLASISGCCANCQHIPDQCTDALYECDLGCLIKNLCATGEAFPCAAPVGCGQFVEEPCFEEPCVEEFVQESCEPANCPTCSPIQACCPLEACNPIKECVLGYRERVAVGPPPVRFQPPMPPKFLTVPTRPVYTAVSPNAPTFDRSQVEVSFGTQLAFPGRD